MVCNTIYSLSRQYPAAPTASVSPERFVSRVGLVPTDLWGRLLDTTMIDLMWSNELLKSPWKRSTKRTHTHTHTRSHTHSHTHYLLETVYSLTDAPIHIHFPLCLGHQYIRSTVTLQVQHLIPYLAYQLSNLVDKWSLLKRSSSVDNRSLLIRPC